MTDNVGNVGVAGWDFNLDGCGVHKEGTTDGSGSIVWNNLLPCANYIVTEVDANTNGFSVTPSATQSVNIGAGDEVAVTFHNRRDPGTTPGTPETPTNTPTNTPTATNTPPTTDETPTDTPPADATDTPTPVETVAGAETPGPGNQATPIAPDSGSGLAGTTSGTNILMILLGLAAITMGSGFLAIGRKRS